MPRVCLDPGHGGPDPGAVGPTGLTEKEVTLDICRRAKPLLEERGILVVLTRDADVSPSGDNIALHDLDARCYIANNTNCDVFVSVHCNSSTNRLAGGAECYYYARSPEGKGYLLAQAVLDNLIASAGAFGLGPNFKGTYAVYDEDVATKEFLAQADLNNRGVKAAHFYVLVHTAMPACLVEVAFITNPAEEKLLRNPDFRQAAAEGIARGICAYLGVVWNNMEYYRNKALKKLSEKARFNTEHATNELVDLGMLAIILERLGII